jgi:hypothetical protein
MVQFDALGLEIVAAELGEFAVDLAEALEPFVEVGFFFEEESGQAGEFDGEDVSEAGGEALAVRGLAEIAGVFGQALGGQDGFLVAEPFEAARGAPFGEVLLSDWAAGEVFLEDFLDRGLPVESGKDFGGGDAVLEEEVELMAVCFGKPPDFTNMCTHRPPFWQGKWGCHVAGQHNRSGIFLTGNIPGEEYLKAGICVWKVHGGKWM